MMPTKPAVVFIAGSIAISRLDPLVLDRIASIVDKRMSVVVGDADGADLAIQRALETLGADAVTVYCSNGVTRNNVGGWPVAAVETSARRGSRAFFTAKDHAMAEVADYGLMIWDTKSTGTLNNVIELLSGGKTSIVFINRDQSFTTVNDAPSLLHLTERMSDTDRRTAEQKISLSSRLDRINAAQLALSL